MTVISFCVPCMNRTNDLKKALPHMIAAAAASLPVEIAVLDYNSTDGLRQYMDEVIKTTDLDGLSIVYTRYEGRDHYHLAHAYNLAAKCSAGDYVAIMGADAVLSGEYVVEARKLIAVGAVWMRGKNYKGILVCKRGEFMDARGYDERFEFYGGEDKELEARLVRRGSQFGLMLDGLVKVVKTRNEDKLTNYRLPLTKMQMMIRGRKIREINNAVGLLAANAGREWGAQ